LLRLMSLGRTTFRLALAKPLSMSRGRDREELGPLGLATQMLALAKPPSMSRGRGGYGMRKEEVVLDS
jgi:hypothetical protein